MAQTAAVKYLEKENDDGTYAENPPKGNDKRARPILRCHLALPASRQKGIHEACRIRGGK